MTMPVISKKFGLMVAALGLFVALLVLQGTSVFPLGVGDFAFFATLIFLVALYRPAWGFLFFVTLIPLETLNVAPDEFGIAVRPYQLVGGLTLVAVLLRALSGRKAFRLLKPDYRDVFPTLIVLGAFVATLNAPSAGAALKQAVIIASFAALYALVRHFVRNAADAKELLVFVIGAGVVVSILALWQNIRFAHGLPSFEVMPGRPNATFTEPDWLGMYMALLISVVYGLIGYGYASQERLSNKKSIVAGLYAILVFFFVTLILTVARSAWLGVAVATVLAVVAVVMNGSLDRSRWQWKLGAFYAFSLALTGVVAFGVVVWLHLTTFDLFNRTQSTASGLQSITIACDREVDLPGHIATVDELEMYACRHINLEDIDRERSEGKIIREVYRDDPTVSIRRQTYATVWSLIRQHPVLGIGWGSVGAFLGTDSRGAVLNASNMFLEVWLGSGLLGLLALIGWIVVIITAAVRTFFVVAALDKKKTLAAIMLLSGSGVFVFNMFNSGILLGFVWLWLGVASVFSLVSSKKY